ncbi:aquaporin-9-like protein [Leptotrombidium deliense]|uniref:Aquaporin-9-like protein n=1 Tax=Leptotrombidium deliense TaxID=299467 RepID=A0A443S6I0_9ACAR|nr:aquaporin-9-like protein [Leptotrombidium deliense]
MKRDLLKTKNTSMREFLAETLGTFTLVCIGLSVNAAVLLSRTDGATIIGCLGWGLALTAAIYICGGISGGHCNPAVTIGLASVGKLSWRKVPHYFAAQYLGAFLGAVVTYCVYIDAIQNSNGRELKVVGENGTARIFSTFPNENSSILTCFVDQIVASAFFLLLINAIIDKKNMECPKGLVPVAIGFTNLSLVLFSFGFNCEGPLNPARDLSPRLFTLIAGWGNEVFSVRNYFYFWVPIVAPHFGAVIGSWIYMLFIENHWESEYVEIPQ